MRSAECGDCVHYSAALQYEESRHSKTSGLPPGKWMMEISPEVQDAVNDALEAAQRGQFQSALDALNALLRDHPLHHDVPYGIGLVHAIRGRYEESIEWFDRAIRIYPDSLEAHYNKAVSFQKLLDLPNCIRCYRKVVQIGPASDPEVAKARAIVDDLAATVQRTEGVDLDVYLRSADTFNQAFATMERGDWNAALKGFRASAALNGRNAPCHGNMGLCLALLGRKAEALAELDRALEIDPNYQPARSNRLLVEKMAEGRPLDGVGFESINFARDKLSTRPG
jgi:tetratricopeptide (TPR) repeat protein